MRLIDADAAKQTYTADLFDAEEDFERVNDIFDYAPTVDAEVVVRCKDCEYNYKTITHLYLCRSHGVCIDCEVPPNFYCAEGKRKEPDE